MFETKGQKLVEIFSELLLLWTCVFLSQFLVKNYNAEQFELLEQCSLCVFFLLILVNVSYVVYMLCVNSKAKKRIKWLAKQKENYHQALKDKEQEKKDDIRRAQI